MGRLSEEMLVFSDPFASFSGTSWMVVALSGGRVNAASLLSGVGGSISLRELWELRESLLRRIGA